MEPKAAFRDIKWHVNYARKEQIKRLNEWLEEDPTNTIGAFLNHPAEWQLDSLIRYAQNYLPDIEIGIKQLDKKPILERLQFWKK
jgi:hypothetical protein